MLGCDHGGSIAYNLVYKLKSVCHGLFMWQKEAGRNEQKEICWLKEELWNAYQQPVFEGQRI